MISVMSDLKDFIENIDIKKLTIKLIPYSVIAYLGNKLIYLYGRIPGDNFFIKIFDMLQYLNHLFENPLPSFNGIDLIGGFLIALTIYGVVYSKGKNAKKYRKGVEYGSARWGTRKDIKPYIDKNFQDNVILTQSESLMMNSRPKDPKNSRNKNILVVGGSGSGKTRFFVKPNLMQMHSSYVVTDPKGTILGECGELLAKGPPKRKYGKDGKLIKDRKGNLEYVRDKEGKIVHEPYNIKVLNTINFSKSMHYNPFEYLRGEKDILKLI